MPVLRSSCASPGSHFLRTARAIRGVAACVATRTRINRCGRTLSLLACRFRDPAGVLVRIPK